MEVQESMEVQDSMEVQGSIEGPVPIEVRGMLCQRLRLYPEPPFALPL
jgi:hypothetical protein